VKGPPVAAFSIESERHGGFWERRKGAQGFRPWTSALAAVELSRLLPSVHQSPSVSNGLRPGIGMRIPAESLVHRGVAVLLAARRFRNQLELLLP
jgi:hypothetical protein